MFGRTSRLAIGLVAAFCSTMAPAAAGYCDGLMAGGLDLEETGYTLGPNLLINGELRSGQQGWKFDPSCFSVDGSGDSASLRLQEPCAQPSPFAENAFKCPPGLFTISAEIKTQSSFTAPKHLGGARVRLLEMPADKWAMTAPVAGATDWSPVAKAHAEVADGSVGAFRAETVGPVAGTSWFRKLFLGREVPAPLQTFLLFPNYRGMMFSDQSQVARVAIDVNPPAATTLAQLRVALEVMDASGKVLLTNRLAPRERRFGCDHRHDQSSARTISAAGIPGRRRRQAHLHAVVVHHREGRRRGARLDEGVDRFRQYHSHGRAPAICDRLVRHDRLRAAPRLLRAAPAGDRARRRSIS